MHSKLAFRMPPPPRRLTTKSRSAPSSPEAAPTKSKTRLEPRSLYKDKLDLERSHSVGPLNSSKQTSMQAMGSPQLNFQQIQNQKKQTQNQNRNHKEENEAESDSVDNFLLAKDRSMNSRRGAISEERFKEEGVVNDFEQLEFEDEEEPILMMPQIHSRLSMRIIDPSDIRLDSMIQILRRATLLAKQQAIICDAYEAVESERGHLRKESAETPGTRTEDGLQMSLSLASKIHHHLSNERDVDNTNTNNNNQGQEPKRNSNSNSEDEKTPPPPPPLFQPDHTTWHWNYKDIELYNTSQLTFVITLHLLHLDLCSGPLFPNSVLKWERLKFKNNAPTPRSSHVSACLDDKMIIFGGMCKQMLTDHIFVVKTTGDEDNALEVTPISSLEKFHKTYRVGHCGVPLTHNNCLYLFGGWNDQQYINHGLLFNVTSLKLVVEQQKERILPPARRDHSLAKMGPFLLLFGGWSHDFFGNELWCLGANWKWQLLKNTNGIAPSPRRGHSASVIDSQMFIFGGLYGFSKYLNDLHIYNGDSNEWSQPQLIGKTRPAPRAWHTANVIGKKQILVFGGTQGRLTFFNECWVFDAKGYFWFQVEISGEVPRPRCSHTMVEVFSDQSFMDDPCWEDTAYQDEHIYEQYERKCRLRLIMFGGLVPISVDPQQVLSRATSTEMKQCEEKEELTLEVKKKTKKKYISHSVESKVTITDVDGVTTPVHHNSHNVNSPSSNNETGREKKFLNSEAFTDIDTDYMTDEDDSQSDTESDDESIQMTNVNQIELSDDLYQLVLEV